MRYLLIFVLFLLVSNKSPLQASLSSSQGASNGSNEYVRMPSDITETLIPIQENHFSYKAFEEREIPDSRMLPVVEGMSNHRLPLDLVVTIAQYVGKIESKEAKKICSENCLWCCCCSVLFSGLFGALYFAVVILKLRLSPNEAQGGING